MMSIHGTLEAIFARFTELAKPERKFLTELFEIIPCVRGRLNFTNLSRYSFYNEVTFRRHFAKFFDAKFFDWLKFNYLIISFACFSKSKTLVAAMDCSYISKSGKKTYGIDRFWSGVANRTKKGLEISLISLIETDTGNAWSLDVRQTPPNLSAKEGSVKDYTRVDFYVEQMVDCFIHVPDIEYYIGDGYYTKKKVMDTVTEHNKHFIGKLRSDANLKYLLDKTQNPNAHGNRKYDGKVSWKALNLDKWEEIGPDQKAGEILNRVLFYRFFVRTIVKT